MHGNTYWDSIPAVAIILGSKHLTGIEYYILLNYHFYFQYSKTIVQPNKIVSKNQICTAIHITLFTYCDPIPAVAIILGSKICPYLLQPYRTQQNTIMTRRWVWEFLS